MTTETAHVERLYQAARAVVQAHARFRTAATVAVAARRARQETRPADAALVVASRTLDTVADELREVLGMPAEIQPGELLAPHLTEDTARG